MDSVATCVLFYSWLKVNKIRRQIQERRLRLRRWWVRPHLAENVRNTFGLHETLFLYFKHNDHEEFFKMMRMTVTQFDELHDMLKTRLQKSYVIRSPLPSELKLALTLKYLGHGDSLETTARTFFVGVSTAYKIVAEVSSIIWEELHKKYLSVKTVEDWQKIAYEYCELWEFPNCIGAIDGKHIRILKPPKSGSRFYNYKKFFSLVLLASCDAHHRFVWIDVGDCGSMSDVSVFENSSLYKLLKRKEANVPHASTLPGTNIKVPHFFIGDEIFPLSTFLMRPYSRRLVSNLKENIFNYRLSSARMTIVNTFGIIVAKWRVLQQSLGFSLKTDRNIVKAIVCLHNFLITDELENNHEDRLYNSPNLIDTILESGEIKQGDWRTMVNIEDFQSTNLEKTCNDNEDLSVTALQQRDILANYFLAEEGYVNDN